MIDTDKHGYNGEIGSSAGIRGKGRASAFQCPKCEGELMMVLVHFQYDGGELDLIQDDPSITVEDYFSSFAAYGTCMGCGTESCIATYELA